MNKYVVVAIGTVMLIGADQVVQNKEVALAIAGRQTFGTVDLIKAENRHR